MSTDIRPELSKRHRYWISKHRYYELKHFCLQYDEWKKRAAEISETLYRSPSFNRETVSTDISDPVYKLVEARDFFLRRIALVEDNCREVAGDLAPYLLKAVTEGVSYENLSMVDRIPCCRDVYYDIYRQFFWSLGMDRE